MLQISSHILFVNSDIVTVSYIVYNMKIMIP